MNYKGLSNRSNWGNRTIATLGVVVAGLTFAETGPSYEVPPDQTPSELAAPALVSGSNFHVVDPVRSDGLMHRYVIESHFGTFEAYGQSQLTVRVHEVSALTELAKTSNVEVAVGGVANGVTSQVNTVVGVATHPVQTVTGIPKGIAHLFHGYADRGKELLADAKHDREPSEPGADKGSDVASKGGDAATRYAARYFGVSSAERRWYQKLGVDPYTDNAILRAAIHKAARVDAAAGFGMKFVGIPGVPGVGLMSKATDAIYNEDPATIRARTRGTLAGYGLTLEEIEHWQNKLILSPTRQVLLLAAAEALGGVEGRGELFRHAISLRAPEEAQVYLQSVGLLVMAHRQNPVQSILPGVRLPAAKRADGHIIVCGAFESVYWTADVAKGESQIREALPTEGIAARELVLSGTTSERARTELVALGWTVRESQISSAPDTGSK